MSARSASAGAWSIAAVRWPTVLVLVPTVPGSPWTAAGGLRNARATGPRTRLQRSPSRFAPYRFQAPRAAAGGRKGQPEGLREQSSGRVWLQHTHPGRPSLVALQRVLRPSPARSGGARGHSPPATSRLAVWSSTFGVLACAVENRALWSLPSVSPRWNWRN